MDMDDMEQGENNDSTSSDDTELGVFEEDISWGSLPCTILESVYRSMTCCERLRVSSVCRKWRQCLYTPRLWWDIKIDVINKREGNKAFFLSKMVHFSQNVHIYWPAEFTRGKVHRPREVDMHNKETLKMFFSAMRNCKTLRTLSLKLENPCAFSPDFSRPTREHMSVVFQQNSRLKSLSFGCNSTIIPPNIISLIPDKVKNNLQECHVGRIRPNFSCSSLESVPVLCNNELENFSHFQIIKDLSLDWSNVSCGVIQGLTAAGGTLSHFEKLNIFVDSHPCTNRMHPSSYDWESFSQKHRHVTVSLVFVGTFDGVCNSLQLVQPRVNTVKVLECAFVDPEEFGKLLHWFEDDLQVLVFVGVWDSIELETGPALWPFIATCQNIRHLAFLGHFVLDEVLLFIASHFSLKSFIVSRAHIMMLSEASHYLLPTSAGKYNHFKQEMSALLQRPWEAINRIPLEGFYFAEGSDDTFYLHESGST